MHSNETIGKAAGATLPEVFRELEAADSSVASDLGVVVVERMVPVLAAAVNVLHAI